MMAFVFKLDISDIEGEFKETLAESLPEHLIDEIESYATLEEISKALANVVIRREVFL
jgi:hypothetical protein